MECDKDYYKGYDERIEISKKYELFQQDYILNSRDSFYITYPTTSNFNNIFQKKDYLIYLNYETLVNYYIYDYLNNYQGHIDEILELIDFLKNDRLNKKLKIIDFIIKDITLYNIIKKYYVTKDKLNLNSHDYNLLNHIFIHKLKIFTEEHILKLIRKSYENIIIDKEGLVDIINKKDLIKGHKAENTTIQEQKQGIDMWLLNKENKQKFSIKNIKLEENSELNIVQHNGIYKMIIYNQLCEVVEYKSGFNIMRFNFITINNKDEIMFVNTKPINIITNRKKDKLLTIEFNKNLIQENSDLDKFIKKYKIS